MFAPKTAPGPAPLALGCMNFGKRTPRDEALRLVDAAVEAGIGLLDTANVYNDGESERIVGQALRAHPGLAVATKVGFGRVEGRPEGLRPERILAACDASLARLGVDAIDLYYLHGPDPEVPFEDSLGAVTRLIEAGKVRHFGVSNHASWQVLEMKPLLFPAVAQQLYNTLVRQLDLEWFRFARRHGVHTTVYNPLAGGLLAGTHQHDARAPKGSRFDRNPLYRGRYWHRAMFEAVEALQGIAAAEGLSLLALAYAFVLHHPGVDSVLVGPATVAHLRDAVAAREVALSEDAVRAMRRVYVELVGTDASYAR